MCTYLYPVKMHSSSFRYQETSGNLMENGRWLSWGSITYISVESWGPIFEKSNDKLMKKFDLQKT